MTTYQTQLPPYWLYAYMYFRTSLNRHRYDVV